MSQRLRSEPMPVKHWSFAGLMLTYWCNAQCASCYLKCGPQASEEMSVDTALRIWRELIEASPHGCRIHLSGGEPFGNWERLIELCRRAHSQGLAPLQKVETNAFWAVDDSVVRQRLNALDAAGMEKIAISADPYHQQFVPLENCRRLARIAEEMYGFDRVQVRWRDWLEHGQDTSAMSSSEREALFEKYAESGRDRFNGRAVETLAPHLSQKSAAAFADNHCREALLRSRHVHVDAAGRVMPGTCAGIVLGDASKQTIRQIWDRLEKEYADRPVVGTLASRGPLGLLEHARSLGYREPTDGYAGKCHLCWEIRNFLVNLGGYPQELGPETIYRKS